MIELAVRWRHGTLALFCLLSLFGLLSLFSLPMELQPGGDTPEITISTGYPGAGPAEVEDLITRPLEDVLEEVEGIKEMTSSSQLGASSITMEFDWGVNLSRKLIEVINKLNQANTLPPEASESNVQIASGGGGANAVMWVTLTPLEGFESDSDHYRDLVEEVVVPELRRVKGTSSFIIVGGRKREVEVLVDPAALAARNLSITQVSDLLRQNNRDSRGGPLVTGRREYRVSTRSRAKTTEAFDDFVLRRDEAGTVFLRDVAETRIGRQFRDSFFLYNGEPAAAIGIIRQVGANVPDLARRLVTTLDDLEKRLQGRGEKLRINIAYNESDYVDQSVSLVRQNLLLGGILATFVLLVFLGSLRTVGVCAISIPTTLVVVFLLLWFFGQTLNILTLAGLAFAVGMVIDNAIVVIENIFTKLEKGQAPVRAAIDGTQEVGGALLASTLTTVAVFTPLVLVEGEAGRVFRALGVTLASAVALSLFAAITLVPMLSGLLLTRGEAELQCEAGGLTGMVARLARWFKTFQDAFIRFLQATAEWSIGPEYSRRRWTIFGGCLALLTAAYLLLPPADYLPQGNRNLIFWLMEPYPGTSIPEAEELTVPPRQFLDTIDLVEGSFLVFGRFRGIGVKLEEDQVSGPNLDRVLNQLMPVGFSFPGFRFMFPIRLPIFSDPGKQFELRLVGPDLEQLTQLEGQLQGQLREIPGIVGVRGDFVFGAPELRVMPERERLAEVEISAAELAANVESALGGRFASEYVDGKETLDVVVKLKDVAVETPSDLRQLVLYTPNGEVQVQDVAEVVETTGPDKINHVNLERSITLTVDIAKTAPLADTVERAEKEVLAPLRQQLPRGYRAYISGTADQLTATLTQLLSVFLFSLLITYLLLMALYRSFIYPLVIMMTVPLGLTGAVLSLVVAIQVSRFVPFLSVSLDMITAIGFVILTGIVVNNAILLVDRALQLQRNGLDFHASLATATRDRLRPILMSASTSVLGMLPLALIPGEGAELYQGLGVVLVGGLTFSTVLTPTVVPALMGLFHDAGLQEAGDDPLTAEESAQG